MKTQDKIREIAGQKLSVKDTLQKLSEANFSKFMMIGKSEDGQWVSFFANLDLEEASYAAIHANMIISQQHAMQVHRSDCPKSEESKS